MEKSRRRISMVRLYAELVEESIILVFLELKLAVLEIKKHIRSAEKGAAMMGLGAALLLFALVTFVGTAVAALAIVLPVWLSALIVALSLSFLGVAFVFSGLDKLKHFSIIPSETLARVEDISGKVRKVSARHHEAEHEREAEHEAERFETERVAAPPEKQRVARTQPERAPGLPERRRPERQALRAPGQPERRHAA